MTKEKMPFDRDFNSSSERLTQNEFDILVDQLDKSIQSKKDEGLLIFSSQNQEEPKHDPLSSKTEEKPNPTLTSSENTQEPKPTPIDLSYFGLKNPDDIKIFLLSPAGASIKDEIAAELSFNEALQEERLLEIQEELIKKEEQRALFFQWLLKDKEEAKEAEEELFELQQEIIHEREVYVPSTSPAPPAENFDDLRDFYQRDMEHLNQDQQSLSEQWEELLNEAELLNEKYNAYEEALDELDQLADTFENNPENENSLEDLNHEIDQIGQQEKDIDEKLNQEPSEEEKHQLGNQIKLLQLKKASLQEIHAVKKGEKKFVDAEGKSEGVTSRNAAFLLSKDQELKNEKGEHFLLEKGQKWEEINDSDKAKAKQNFDHSKNELKLVRNHVQDEKKREIDSHIARVAANKVERLTINNRMSLISRAAQVHGLNYSNFQHLPLHPPKSTLTPNQVKSAYSATPKSEKLAYQAPTPKPTPQIYQAALVQTLQDSKKPITWGDLFSFVKTIPNPRTKEDTEKFLTEKEEKEIQKIKDKNKNTFDLSPDELKEKIKEMLRLAPVPETTMNDLLKNMARFEKDAYQPSVTTEISPEEPEKREELEGPEEHEVPNPFRLEPKR